MALPSSKTKALPSGDQDGGESLPLCEGAVSACWSPLRATSQSRWVAGGLVLRYAFSATSNPSRYLSAPALGAVTSARRTASARPSGRQAIWLTLPAPCVSCVRLPVCGSMRNNSLSGCCASEITAAKTSFVGDQAILLTVCPGA